VAAAFGCSKRSVQRIQSDSLVKSRRTGPNERHLSFPERERISRGVACGHSARQIARGLGRAPSTISREVAVNGGRSAYRALSAQRRAIRCAARPKPGKLLRLPRLREEVERGLERRWSPPQISAKLKLTHPDDPEMRISPETIYQSLFVQSRGELRRELTRNLRSGRTKRRPQGRVERRGQIPDMVSISERPPEASDRAPPGHWEGDLILGARGSSAIATLVERQTRYVILAELGGDRTSASVTRALQREMERLPEHLRRSLTWDQGREMTQHARFSVKSGIPVFFCDPHSPWQRGSNENTNGLLRQYFPKGSDLAVHGQIALDRVAAELNDRPRETLEWMAPSERMDELLR